MVQQQTQPVLAMAGAATPPIAIGDSYEAENDATLYHGDCLALLRSLPTESTQLIVTSPPYNIGKKYEDRRGRQTLDDYLAGQKATIDACMRVLRPGGSICWQVGNHVDDGAIYPLDILLYPFFVAHPGVRMRNRIVWTFEHGLHCSNRFSGRHETIIWFTKGDEYTFHLDPVRVPQKYPGKKYYKGPKVGQYSANPLGKNPGDVWVIPNVKHNHPEKTGHPCQFPVELIERLVLSMTDPGDLVVDPYAGVASALVAAVRNGRRGAGADLMEEYIAIGRDRLERAAAGTLPVREIGTPVYEPPAGTSATKRPWEAEMGDPAMNGTNNNHKPVMRPLL